MPSFCGASPTSYGSILSSQSSVVVTPSSGIARKQRVRARVSLKEKRPSFPSQCDELTSAVARRARARGDVIEDEPPSAGDALTLFDASDDEDEAG